MSNACYDNKITYEHQTDEHQTDIQIQMQYKSSKTQYKLYNHKQKSVAIIKYSRLLIYVFVQFII